MFKYMKLLFIVYRLNYFDINLFIYANIDIKINQSYFNDMILL
jgi:hypothetical protein